MMFDLSRKIRRTSHPSDTALRCGWVCAAMAHHEHRHVVANTPEAVTSAHAAVLTLSMDTGPLLLPFWHPTSTVEYMLTLVIIAALGVIAEYCATMSRTAATLPTVVALDDPAKRRLFQENSRRDEPQRVTCLSLVLHATSITLNFVLMLLAMTLNVGIIASVVFGLAVGRTLWGGVGARAVSGAESCH